MKETGLVELNVSPVFSSGVSERVPVLQTGLTEPEISPVFCSWLPEQGSGSCAWFIWLEFWIP